jgi:hypothetical protein
MCRVPCSAEAAAADALELVTTLFGDVDLDNDGRICFTEFQAGPPRSEQGPVK